MPAIVHDWAKLSPEQLNPFARRQAIHSGRMTVARLFLAAGAVVPRHSHENEQITLLEKGRLKFLFDDGETVLNAGQVLQIPGGLSHGVEALEESVALDLFAPVREDWLRGDDAYLRQQDSSS